MVLTEKEKEVLNCLRNPIITQRDTSLVDNLSDKEIISLYNKMDAIMEEEGNFRRSIGSFDEMYLIELCNVKEILFEECTNRGLINKQ